MAVAKNIWKAEINNKTILESVHRNIIRLHNLMQKIKKFLVFFSVLDSIIIKP